MLNFNIPSATIINISTKNILAVIPPRTSTRNNLSFFLNPLFIRNKPSKKFDEVIPAEYIKVYK
jgi:hypothetical protein